MVGNDLLGRHAEDLDTVQPVGLLHLLHDHLVAPRGFVHLDDGVQSPVSDEQEVFEDDQRKGMTDQTGGDCLHIFPLQVSVLEIGKINQKRKIQLNNNLYIPPGTEFQNHIYCLIFLSSNARLNWNNNWLLIRTQ